MEHAHIKERLRQFSLKANNSPVDLVENIICLGSECFASDIHIEPRDLKAVVRMRIDGVLREMFSVSKTLHEPLISRLKILAGLRTDIRHSSQDGRFRFGEALDIRLSLVPTYFGEKAVLRLLSRVAEKRSFKSLGFSKKHEEEIATALAAAQGMILVVGPTGSGKTTTLYTMLEELAGSHISLVTLEDPIEYIIEKATQIPIHVRGGFTFAQALRSVVRQDPDVIMVGEIRDGETAKLAVQSALTGHLLLSTLHTTSAAATLPRLADMGVEPYLVASTIRLIVAERLVRRICNACKTERKISPAEEEYIRRRMVKSIPESIQQKMEQGICGQEALYEGAGCDECGGSGYAGRASINELLVVGKEMQSLIESGASESVISRCMIKNKIPTMFEDGLEKVCQGVTTLTEVLQAVSD